jgi:hypothetical protein
LLSGALALVHGRNLEMMERLDKVPHSLKYTAEA